MNSNLIIIPSYWTKSTFIDDNKTVYDHPTDLDKPEETLSETLKSMTILEREFDVIVLGIPTNPKIGSEVDTAIIRVIENCDLPFSVNYFGTKQLNRLKEKINTIDKFNLISNHGYGNVRNLCLLLPFLLGYESVILIDDDELFSDKFFLKKASEFIGKKIENKILGLVVGYYTDENGSYYLDESSVSKSEEDCWNKPKLMDQSFSIIENKERLVDTTFALGGNLVIHNSCFFIPFDTNIARGEDMDYLRNIEYFGYLAKLDAQLAIVHKPPKSTVNDDIKFKEDIKRFFYASQKMELLKIDPSKYDPYPGYFLKDIREKTKQTMLNKFLEDKNSNSNGLEEEERRIDNYLFKIEHKFREKVSSYISFQEQWKNLLKSLDTFEKIEELCITI